MRGVIIILMALDHSRDFFGDLAADPTNLATTTSPLFFTRWITHFCAPAFFLLTGASAYLAQERFTKPELARFLVSRGLWLIFLELTVMRFALQFNLDYAMSARCSARPTWRTFLSSAPPGWAASLPSIYAVWITVLLIMFPPCRWYAGVKRRSSAWWLSYL